MHHLSYQSKLVYGTWAPHSEYIRGDEFSYDEFQSLDATRDIPIGATHSTNDGEFSRAVSERPGWYALPMKTDDKPAPKKPAGGKRAGAGRKPLDADGTIVQTVRLTAQQKASFDMLGGVSWLRGQLDLFAG